MEISKRDDQRDLIKFASLAVTGVQLGIAPNGVRIDEIVLDGFDGNLVIEADGRTNVKRVVDTAKKESADIAGSLPARLVRAIKESIKGPFPLQIGKLKVKRASTRFEDRSLKPEFKVALGGVEGEMIDISTTQRTTPIKVKINGKVDAVSPLGISGSVVPFGEKTTMDMRVTLQDFQLRSISPYSGKHVGYTVEKGRLSLALDYSLSEDIITGKNDILFKQLTLGERTDSPNAVKLPLNLAIALLKDSKGRIKINLPVSGDINDPEFRVGNVLAGTLIKFVTGIVSSPFKVMEGLAGAFSTKELSGVVFSPGSATLDPGESQKLAAVAKALRERPSLQVEISGRAYVQLDAEAMAPVEPGETPAEKPTIGMQQLRELARQRAYTIREALVVKGKIESGRVTILEAKVEEGGSKGSVVSSLNLTSN